MVTTVPLTVLFVDDDPDMVELVRIAVDGQPDFELIATAHEAVGVLDLIREHHPDVVILDHRLGGRAATATGEFPRGVAIAQTGLELVEGARAAAPAATIVIFTGRTGLGAAAHNVGADAYVEKSALNTMWPAIRAARE